MKERALPQELRRKQSGGEEVLGRLVSSELESAVDLGESEASEAAEPVGGGLLYRAVVAAAVGFVRRAPRPSRSSARWDACGGGLPPGSTAAAFAEERGETAVKTGRGGWRCGRRAGRPRK